MKSMLSAAALAVAAMCASAPANAAAILTFTPASTHIGIGDAVVIDVSISGLGAEVLSALDINFLFSGAAAANTGFDFSALGNALGGVDSVLDIDPNNPAAEVGIVAYSLLDDGVLAGQQADSFLLGSFTFSGAADGVTTISLGADPDFQRNFVGLNARTIEVNVGSACIAVGTGACNVPEPASYALVGLALLGMVAPGVLRRRRRAYIVS